MMEIDKEPGKEDEIWCDYCGPGWKAAWEVMTDEDHLFVCNDHHFILRQIHVVGWERRIIEEKWSEASYSKKQDLESEPWEDLGDWKDLIDHHEL
jgi:hypothetical protein